MKRRRAGVRVAVLGAPGPAARSERVASGGTRKGIEKRMWYVDLWTFVVIPPKSTVSESHTAPFCVYVLGTVASDGPQTDPRRHAGRDGVGDDGPDPPAGDIEITRHDVRLSLPPRAPSSRVCTRFLLTRGSAPLPVGDRHGACSSLVHRSRPCPECCIDSPPLAGTRCPAREAGAV